MKNSVLITIVVITLIVVGGLAYYFLFNNSNTSTITNNQPTSNTQPSTNNQSATNPITSTPRTYDIEIKGFAFSPAILTIKKGDSVRWTNKDSMKHTATADNGKFDSKTLNKDQSFTFTFNEAGEYSYICSIHPYMKAKIIVE